MSETESSTGELLANLLAAKPAQHGELLRAAGADIEATLLGLGDEAERTALVEVARALRATDLVVRLADEFGTIRTRARARRARAQALAYAGQHAQALAACQQAVEIAGDDEPIEAGRARIASMHPLGELGRYDEAVAEGEQAHATLMAARQPALAARADFNLGGIHQNRDDPKRALFHFDRAAPAFKDDPLIGGYLQNNRGEALLLLNDFDGAERAFRAALQACEQANANVAAAIAEGNLADLASRRGRLQESLRHFEHARLRLEKDAAFSHAARILGEQAETLETLGLPEDAADAYQQAIDQLDQHGLAWESARARTGLGRTLLRLGRLDEAERTLSQAAASFENLGHDNARAQVDMVRCEVALAAGRLHQARQWVEKAAARLGQRDLDRVLLLCQQARLEAAETHGQRAIAALSSAWAIADRYDIPPLSVRILHLLGNYRRKFGQPQEGLEALERAVEQTERIRGTLQADRFREALIGDRATLYDDLISAELAAVPQRPDRLLAAIEHAKARTLLDTLRGVVDETDELTSDEDQRRRAQLREELNVLYSRLADAQHLRRTTMDLPDLPREIEPRERELARLEQRLASRSAAGMIHARPVPLDCVRVAMGGDTLVEFFQANQQTYALLVAGNTTRVVGPLATASELAERVAQLRFQLNRGLRSLTSAARRRARLLDDVRYELRWLYDTLIAPWLGELATPDRLAIVPHGPLHLMPLHAAWDGSKYLIERAPIHVGPSASILTQLAENPPATNTNTEPLVIGVADEHAPNIEAEAEEIAALIGGAKLIGPAATVARVTAALPGAAVVHFGCHGVFSQKAPNASGLKLHDRWLTLGEIARLRMSADMVVLSGCSTGRTAHRAAEEFIGLSRTLLAAGVSSLVASLWMVDDKRTREMMRDYYTIWSALPRRRGAAAEALRHAMLGALKDDAHPASWAPFILVGNP